MQNVESWASQNNLNLNRSKTSEIVFYNRRRILSYQQPSEVSDIKRTTTIKILGVTFTSNLSMSTHVQNVINSCSQTLYALKTLRVHGLPSDALKNIYRSVVVAKVMYAACAWSGFTNSRDRQRIDSFLQRGKCSGFCPTDIQDFAGLCNTADVKLLKSVLANCNHTLYPLLPDKSAASEYHNLRPRPHDRQLPNFKYELTRCNFFNRALYFKL